MISIDLIRDGSKIYSIKSNIILNKDKNEMLLRILNVTEVKQDSRTSFSKLKDVFVYSNYPFNVTKYKIIYDKLIHNFYTRFKVNQINLY
jgi:hypothetical protein